MCFSAEEAAHARVDLKLVPMPSSAAGQAQPDADAVVDGGRHIHAARAAGCAASPRLAGGTPARHGSDRSAVFGAAVTVARLGLAGGP